MGPAHWLPIEIKTPSSMLRKRSLMAYPRWPYARFWPMRVLLLRSHISGYGSKPVAASKLDTCMRLLMIGLWFRSLTPQTGPRDSTAMPHGRAVPKGS